ncbi:MAG: hypothetical protein LBE91_19630 [Tannerella sp.]|nr:hypothetical protein [Tannerella sp.]
MKKIILLSLFVAMAATVKSQADLPYKPLSSFKNDKVFNNDTVAYLVYNFKTRADFYKGKTVDEVLKDIRVPVAFYQISVILRPIGNRALRLYFNSDTKSDSSYYLYIISYTNYPKDPTLIEEWSAEIYELLKSNKVESVGVSVPRNSEYFKEEERKWKEESEKESKKREEAFRRNFEKNNKGGNPHPLTPEMIKEMIKGMKDSIP